MSEKLLRENLEHYVKIIQHWKNSDKFKNLICPKCFSILHFETTNCDETEHIEQLYTCSDCRQDYQFHYDLTCVEMNEHDEEKNETHRTMISMSDDSIEKFKL